VCLKRERNGKSEAASCELLSAQTRSVTLDGCSAWVMANAGSLGYYRTNYDSKDLNAIGAALRHASLSDIEETSLVDDAWVLARLNQQDIADFLRLSRNLLAVTTGPAVTSALERINFVADHLIDPPQRPAFEQWVRDSVKPVIDEMGTAPREQEDVDRRAVRAAAFYTLGYAGHDSAVLNEARQSVDRQLGNAGSIDSSLTATFLQLAALDGDRTLYEKYLDQMRRTAGGRQNPYRTALSYFRDPALRKQTLEYALSPGVRPQDAAGVIAGLLSRPESAPDAWKFVQANWEALQRIGGPQTLSTIVNATGSFCDVSTRDEVQRFFQTHSGRGVDQQSRQALETIDRCIQTRRQQSQNLNAFLR
jgi:aminopeptidase N